MTEKERYDIVIDALAEKLKEKSSKIAIQEWQITDLRRQLAEAEHKIKELEKGAKKSQ